MLQFSALGTLGIAAVILCWSLAAVLYRVETVSGAARQLAFLLVVEGVTLVPNTHNTPEYVALRKLQVYEEAVAEAPSEGGISRKERGLLVRLRDSLGVSEADAESIERELQARPGASS